jgi:hypothetical protein
VISGTRNEIEVEPLPGLPEHLPEGERVLWQGSPDWKVLAKTAFHVRKVAAYFVLLMTWRVVSGLYDGNSLMDALTYASALLIPAVCSVALLLLVAWLNHRATVYTITNKRVAMRFGIALPISLNLPFKKIAAAGVKINKDGTGDIPLELKGGDRIGYAVLWPHVRPWHINNPEPMLRAIPDAQRVGSLLANAVAATETVSISTVATQSPNGITSGVADAGEMTPAMA